MSLTGSGYKKEVIFGEKDHRTVYLSIIYSNKE